MENKLKIAIQGVLGSFHHQVAQQYFGEQIDVYGFNTFEEVGKSVENGTVDFAVMAIENSIAGAILPNYDIIDRHELFVIDEHYLPISHNLMALPGQQLTAIREARSHPMALLQCKQFFSKHPDIQPVDDVDTAYVAKLIAEKKLMGVAAVASTKAADFYGLEILARDIQTVKNNFTRFIILQKNQPDPANAPTKASLKITVRNVKGVLAKLLTVMSEHDLDLTKIQSIPVMSKPWEYSFFIDTLIAEKERFNAAIRVIEANYGTVKIFGVYQNRKQ
ncbi:prephenate dehydratase [Cyclobacterium lianum]|uniref:prephenate dehydratase n=1 Tax=Cyclobacterium lianum TaxID=388280 RepID=A0A1M7PM24_9BACT|nr:prephenate dehydratase [Cyclobacterium lianum]SHN18102.1 prephenate dehydratase [Cyclobacterium lianum]